MEWKQWMTVMFVAIAGFVCVAHATYCGRPPSINNGYRSAGSYRYFRAGFVIKYGCNTGYLLHGYSSTTCLYDIDSRSYHWSRSAPRCIRMFFIDFTSHNI